MDRNDKEFLTNFKSSYEQMIATNEQSYSSSYGYGFSWRSKYRSKKYTVEEIENIIDSGSTLAQIQLSRTFYNKGGFYQRILLHYATLLKYTGLLIPNPSFG